MSNYIIDLLPQGSEAIVLFHYMPWFQINGGSHRNVGYDSTDPNTISQQLDLMLKYCKGMPANRVGVIVDWYGPQNISLNISTLLVKKTCEAKGMKFAICFDRGIVTPNQTMESAVIYANSSFFSSSAYIKEADGSNFCIEFNSVADWLTLSTKYKLHCLSWKPGGYAWLKCVAGQNPNAINQLIIDNQNVEMATVFAGFNDSDPANPSQSKWDGLARFVDYENGNAWLRVWKALRTTVKKIMIGTYNDHDERSGIEGKLGMKVTVDDLPTGSAIPNVMADTLPVIDKPPIATKTNYQANIVATSNWLAANSMGSDGSILYSADTINPYYGNLAAAGLVKVPSLSAKVTIWIQWVIDHLNKVDKWGLTGTICDHSYSAGKATSLNDADSTDSYAATFCSLVYQYYLVGGINVKSFIASLIFQLDSIGQVIVRTQQSDGLTFAKPDYPIKYLMDNCEAYRGLRDLASLTGSLKATMLQIFYNAQADKMLQGILNMWHSSPGVWMTDKDALSLDMTKWYPDAVAQLYPMLYGVVFPSETKAKIAYGKFIGAWPTWETLSFNNQDEFPWCQVAYAAALMGDTDRANKYIKVIESKYVQNGFPWPWFCEEAGWFIQLNNLLK
jgi:hypothetical protein